MLIDRLILSTKDRDYYSREELSEMTAFTNCVYLYASWHFAYVLIATLSLFFVYFHNL